jgi:acyl-CoA synthetase (AMP-forming)/AMP-acid ligase II
MTRTFVDMVDMLRSQAARLGEKTAFVYLKDGEDDEERTTYAGLERNAQRISRALLELRDDGEQNNALLLCKPGESYISAYFGVLFAGWTPVPVYPPTPSRKSNALPRLLSILADSQAAAIVTTADLRPLIEQLLASFPAAGAPALVVTDALESGDRAPPREPRRRSEIALIQYTSGSVSEPKGVLVSHANLLDNLEQIREATGKAGENARVVSWLPPFHDMGLIGAILYPLYTGGESVLMTPLQFLSRPFRWLRAVSRYRANMIVVGFVSRRSNPRSESGSICRASKWRGTVQSRSATRYSENLPSTSRRRVSKRVPSILATAWPSRRCSSPEATTAPSSCRRFPVRSSLEVRRAPRSTATRTHCRS